MKKCTLFALVVLLVFNPELKSQESVPVINEDTPSKAIYFSWINHAWEGTDAIQTMANLDFFKWMYDEYGMKLDLYLIDAGTLDEGPECIGKLFGDNRYGSLDSKPFLQKFPEGLGPVSFKAGTFGCRLGMWLGPDGYGTSPAEASKRSEILVSLCRDYGIELFKFDACCSDLAKDNQQNFIHTMKECRKYSPDLIVLNHRISFNDEAKQQTTTWLWEGRETYIDVHFPGNMTGTHHRTGTLSRGTVPQLQRLTEDHGVCISSCLDFWEDDLILQAFNRSLILAPEIYGNPWLLKDDEFAKLARIYNLHKLYNQILVNGINLPPENYGENAVSRGDSLTRIITLRNLTWLPKTVRVKLDSSIGLSGHRTVEVRQIHPIETILGNYIAGSEVAVNIQPFRACLLVVSGNQFAEPGIRGADYEIVKNRPGEPVEINLCGLPGNHHRISLIDGSRNFTRATLDGKSVIGLVSGKPMSIRFEGKEFKLDYHRKLADAEKVEIPADAEALYEATCFAADNNALEVRSLMRSGPTAIPAVQHARDCFFNREAFINKGIWDQYLFDNDTATCFRISPSINEKNRVFRIDLGSGTPIDSLVITNSKTTSCISAECSADLMNWKPVEVIHQGDQIKLIFSTDQMPLQYIRIKYSPASVAEITGFFKGIALSRSGWKASNLFSSFEKKDFTSALQATFSLMEIPEQSYLAIAIPGHYAPESVFAALRIDGKPAGTPDRAISFPSNTWEAPVSSDIKGNYTYYFPLEPAMTDKSIEVVILGNNGNPDTFQAEIWITAYPLPYSKKKLVLE